MKKRTLAAVAAWTLLGVVGAGSAQAQDDHGDTRGTANLWTLDDEFRKGNFNNRMGQFERPNDIDYLRISLSRRGILEITSPSRLLIRILCRMWTLQ